MRQREIYIIIGLMSLALLGIIGLQVHQLRQALTINEATFSQSVNDALAQVVDQLQSSELKTNFVRYSRQLNIRLPKPDSTADSTQTGAAQAGGFGPVEKPITRGAQRVRIRDSLAIVTEQETFLNLDSTYLGGKELSYVYLSSEETDSSDLAMQLRGHPRVLEMMGRTLEGLTGLQRSLEERLDSVQVDTLLRQALADRGLPLEYRFAVAPNQARQDLFVKPGDDSPEAATFRAQLFPYLSGPQKSYLYLYFPQQELHVLSSVWVQALLSLLFSSIILLGFWLSIRTIYRQKRLSEMKNDFINNMTHELKTPIATISLAADAIDNPRIRGSADSLDRYSRIIREENQRMHRQVERVLLAARFDRGEIELKKERTNVHEVIAKAAANIELQVQERGGRLEQDLKADPPFIQADRVHLSNIVYNLLDNANKYSPEAPQIKVRTRTSGGYLVIQVSDRGMGISPSNQQEIFTRFYRVSTGNLHDVKGFGLGLSYVREMTEAHEGKVEVSSLPGRGSTFTIYLPFSIGEGEP